MWCHNFINMCSKLIIFLPRLVMYDCHLIMSYFYKKKNYNISSHLFKNWFKTFFSHFFLFINEFFAGDIGGGGCILECITYLPFYCSYRYMHMFVFMCCLSCIIFHVIYIVCLGLEIGRWRMKLMFIAYPINN